MSSSGFFRADKLKGKTRILVASMHNKRAIPSAPHIHRHLSHQNYSIHGPHTPELVAEHAKKLMLDARVKKLRVDAVVAIEVIFSLPVGSLIFHQQYFRDCLEWTAEKYGGLTNILSADVHLDESAHHMHVLILPLVDGRMNGSELHGYRPRLVRLQDEFHDTVGSRYGLRKAARRISAAEREKLGGEVIARLVRNNDVVVKSHMWPQVRDAIGRDPRPYALALGIEFVLRGRDQEHPVHR